MPRPPRQYSGSLTPGQASYVLERLIGERRVSAADVERYVKEMQSEISTLEQRLQRLRDAVGPAAAAAAAGIAAGAAGAAVMRRGRKPGRPGRPPGRPGRPAGRRGRPPAAATAGASTGAGTNGGGAAAAPASSGRAGAKRGRKSGGGASLSPQQLASRQLQGRYLAIVRQFPETRRAYFAKVAKEKGREAAIKEMQDSIKK